MKKLQAFIILLTMSAASACTSLPEGDVEIIAHRGVPYAAPENTLASARLAWERGADAVEIDVHQTRDGQIVVIHDSSTIRVAAVNKFIRHTDYDELKKIDVGSHFSSRFSGERIPLLAEVLEILPSGKNIYAEIKSDSTLLPEMARVIRKSGREENVRIISFRKQVLQQAKQLIPGVPCYLLLLHVPQKGRSALMKELEHLGLDGVDLFHAAVTPGLVSELSNNGFACITWTVNSFAAARRLIEAGVTGITTNMAGCFKKRK